MHAPRLRSLLTCLLVVGLLAVPAWACLWDYDTLRMERRQFPDALELITGRFLRHGEAFYRWRIADRTPRLALAPDDLRLRDDLAVAHEKVGETQKAIDLMLVSLEQAPERYETHANLGTFYIHAGEHEKGLDHIRRAIEINPDAHFGREIVQQRLVEYVRARRGAGATLPLDPQAEGWGARGFTRWLAGNHAGEDEEPDIAAALKGVLGMMRFGNFDSPVLLEVLGDLLLAGSPESGGAARRLACRAYLKASFETEGATRDAYRGLATISLSMQTKHPDTTDVLTVAEVERALRKEIAAAESFHAGVVANEERWIREGANPEERFDAVYFGVEPPPAEDGGGQDASGGDAVTLQLLLLAAAVALVISALAWWLTRRRPGP